MPSPFFFLITIVLISLISSYFFYRGLGGHGGAYVIAGVGFAIVSAYLFGYGIPTSPTITTTVLSSTVTTNVVTYSSLKASADPIVNGIAWLFASFGLLSLGISIGAVPKSTLEKIFKVNGDQF